MKLGIIRAGVGVASVVGLLGLPSTPASATSAGVISFTGNAITGGGGLGFACTLADIPGNVPGCLLTAVTGTTITTKPKPVLGFLPNVNVTQSSGNYRTFTFSSKTCVSGKASVFKTKTPANAGLCFIAASGVITGYCELATGAGTHGSWMTGVVGNQGLTFFLKFVIVAGNTVVTGIATDTSTGKSGPIKGLLLAFPDPIPSTGSCFDKTSTHFTFIGNLAFVLP